MWGHVHHLLGQALGALPLASLVVPFAVLLVSLMLILVLRGWPEMKRRWLESIGISVGAMVVVFLFFFLYSVCAAIYADHMSMVAKIRSLEQSKSRLVDPKSRDVEISKLTSENKRLLSEESGVVRIFPVAHDIRPGVPKMEYVFTTGKLRAPVEISATCDFPIANVNVMPMTVSGASVSDTSKIQASPGKFMISLLGPAWSPQSPLWVTVFFQGSVSKMPSCRFAVQ